MCETCGCGRASEGEHEHVLADGTVTRHAHEGGAAHHGHEGARAHGAARTLVAEASILEANDRVARLNRRALGDARVFALNLMSSPGSGKTALLVHTLRAMQARGQAASVLVGDQETSRDADRIGATGAPALQINTGRGCHLDAAMVARGIERLGPVLGAVLFIENVGNLVCPALFDLGEAAKVVLFSVTEGEDKPLKYPHMFRAADLVLFTKIDLLPHLEFRREEALDAVSAVRPRVPVLEVSARTGQGMAAWLAWLDERRAARA